MADTVYQLVFSKGNSPLLSRKCYFNLISILFGKAEQSLHQGMQKSSVMSALMVKRVANKIFLAS